MQTKRLAPGRYIISTERGDFGVMRSEHAGGVLLSEDTVIRGFWYVETPDSEVFEVPTLRSAKTLVSDL